MTPGMEFESEMVSIGIDKSLTPEHSGMSARIFQTMQRIMRNHIILTSEGLPDGPVERVSLGCSDDAKDGV